MAYMWLSLSLAAKGLWDQAIPAAQKFVDLTAGSVLGLSCLGFHYGSAGMKDEALKILEQLDALSTDRWVGSLYKALIWTGGGEKDKALENLEKTFLERESALAFIKVWPVLDSLRSEPRFQIVLKKMNLDS